MRPNAVKQALKDGKPSVGTWLSLASVLAARFMARTGFEWLAVDVEHSPVDINTASHMFATIADSGCVALARVPSNRHDHVKRMLDNGAHGIIVPMVNTRQEAVDAVNACLYPPRGNRSVGGNSNALNFAATPAEYFAKADGEVLVVLQCEHIHAVERAEEVYSVPGIDAVFVGPADLAASMRGKDGSPPSPAAMSGAVAQVLAACRKIGVPAGIHCSTGEEAKQRIAEGWRMISINSELKMMTDGAAELLKPLGLGGAGTGIKY